jgi:hypothetical protein
MDTIKFGLELSVVFLVFIVALFVIYYKISEKIVAKKLKTGKD